jgi:TolB-like protein/DNA-binding winged helix-turn-helix (wHTH) protein
MQSGAWSNGPPQGTPPIGSPGVVHFGHFEFDQDALELRERGQPRRLQPQPAKVLRLLIAHAGELVTREDLCLAIWGTETFVDFEQGLNFCIKRIRAVLHDDPDRPIYVETIPRRGYRFIAPVERVPAAAPIPPVATHQPDAGRPAAWNRAWLIAGLLAAVGLASIGSYIAWKRAAVPAAADRRIVAVLPFENLSGDPEQEYFSQGFTEETVTHLSRVNPAALAVIARTTIQRYVGAGKTLAEIGGAVGATHIVEGRVRRDGNRVRVTAQLTEVGRQTNVWAESYDRDIRDALIVQQEIALAIARAIDATLSTDAPSMRRAGQVDAEAYQLYLKGRFFWNHRRPASTIKAREYFEQALARDPGFARAYAGLGDIHLATGSAGAPAALDLARKALALDPSLGEAHATAGHAAMHIFDWAAAGASLQRAVQLDPGYTPARYLYAEYLVANGRFDEAIAQARRGVELDPAGSIANHALGTMYYYARRYDEAIRQFNIALELDPSHRWSHSRLGQVYEQQGRYDAAMREFEAGGFPRPPARVSARAGQPREARQLVATSAPHEAALLLAALGEVEAALDALERAANPPSYDMVYLAVDPKLDALRSSPRFSKLLESVGLPRVR